MRTMTVNQYLFLKWMHDTHPGLYEASSAKQLSGFMDSLGTAFTTVIEAAPKLYSQYIDGKTQISLLKANLQRAQQNLPPVDASGQVITTGMPGYAIPAGYPISNNPFASVPPWVWIAGAGVVALLLLKR